jgi:ATP-binding cassette subfamily F protein 3
MLSQSNFLLLDEPTNHLDIVSKEILESALREYDGTCFFISHDRYFINAVAQKIVELKKDGALTYMGDYDYYIERINAKAEEEAEKNNKNFSTAVSVDTSSKIDWKKQKEEQAKQRKKENEIKKIEEKIAETESAISEADAQLCLENVYSDSKKSKEILDKKSELENVLLTLYDEWESLNEQNG